MPTTSRGYPYPLPTDPPDGAVQIHDLAAAINTDVTTIAGDVATGIPIYPNAAARDAAIPAPVLGQQAFLQDLQQGQHYSEFGWVAGVGVTAWGQAFFGGSGLGVGQGRIGIAPASHLVQGGMIWDSVNNCFEAPFSGLYHCVARISANGFVSTNNTLATYVGNIQNIIGYGSQYAAGDYGSPTALCSIYLPLEAGEKMALWYGISVAANLAAADLQFVYVGAVS